VTIGEADIRGLRDRLDGDALVPGDAGWDAGRQAWNLVADQHPAAIVFAESSADAAATVNFARERGLRVAPQSTGHGAATVPDLGGSVLLRLGRLADVSVDPDAGTARVGAGAAWSDVVGPASDHGLACLHGSSGTVGVAGYTLTGGLSWLGRSRGFACNNVRSIDVVTADGEERRVDADHDPDLFWALRGGGGGEAVVTGFEIELCELETAYAGSLMWPIEQAAEIVPVWHALTEAAPEELTSWLKLIRFPPFPQVPEPLRGRALVAVTSVFAGAEEEGAPLLDNLRGVAEPYMDTTATVPAPVLSQIAGDPQDPTPGKGTGRLVERLDGGALDAYVELAGPDADVPLIFLELRHLGGALGRAEEGNGALDCAPCPYLLDGIGAVMSPEASAAIDATFARIQERMEPWLAERTLLGFAEQQPGRAGSFEAATAERLASVKGAYDPDGLIVASHEDAPAA
jgi:FAD/FMN-containing dehydrogenase